MTTSFRAFACFGVLLAVVIAEIGTDGAARQVPLVSGQTVTPPVATSDCNRPMADPIVHVALEASPIHARTTRDGCWVFVRGDGALSVFQRRGGVMLAVGPSIPIPGLGALELTHDDSILIVRGVDALTFFSVQKLTSGSANPALGTIASPRFGKSMSFSNLLVTPDDKFLIASHHSTAWLTVISLEQIRAKGPSEGAIVGGTATPEFPTELQLSPDGKVVYLAEGRAAESVTTPTDCSGSYQIEPSGFRRSGISVLDAAKLLSAPASAFIAEFAVGCEASTLRLSPDGRTLYSLAHADDTLSAYDVTDGPSPHLRLKGTVPVGAGPRDAVLLDGGKTIVVSHGNELGRADQYNWLAVIDAASVDRGAESIRGIIPTRSRMVTMWVTDDQRTLLVPNRDARTLEVVDLARLSLSPLPVATTIGPGGRK
jgi:hypothetical protein